MIKNIKKEHVSIISIKVIDYFIIFSALFILSFITIGSYNIFLGVSFDNDLATPILISSFVIATCGSLFLTMLGVGKIFN